MPKNMLLSHVTTVSHAPRAMSGKLSAMIENSENITSPLLRPGARQSARGG